MTWHDVHLRLLATLPVRTVRRQQDPETRDTSYVGRPRHAATKMRHAAIVRLDAEGLSESEIAERLDVSTTTVRNHLKAK